MSSSTLRQIHQVLKRKDDFPFLSKLQVKDEQLHATIHFAGHLISGYFKEGFDLWDFFLHKRLSFFHPNFCAFAACVGESCANQTLRVFIFGLWQLLHQPNFEDPYNEHYSIKTKEDYLDQFDIKPRLFEDQGILMSLSTKRTFAFSTKGFCYFEGVVDIEDLTYEEFLAEAKTLLVDYLKEGNLTILAEKAEALVLHSPPLDHIRDHPEEKVWLCDAPCGCGHSTPSTNPSTSAK